MNRLPIRPLLIALGLAAVLPAAQAQDYGAGVQYHMNRLNQIVQQAEQGAANIVRQRMQDPQVQAAYRHYLMRMQQAGQQPMDFPTFTYQWVYTRGFSAEGIAHMRRNEAQIQQSEQQAWAGVKEAEQRRGEAQQEQRDHYYRNQQEGGRGLLGQSTYSGYGYQGALPHTWQPNTLNDYQGNRYWVDQGGQYHVLGRDGLWYPIQR